MSEGLRRMLGPAAAKRERKRPSGDQAMRQRARISDCLLDLMRR